MSTACVHDLLIRSPDVTRKVTFRRVTLDFFLFCRVEKVANHPLFFFSFNFQSEQQKQLFVNAFRDFSINYGCMKDFPLKKVIMSS